MLTTPSVSGVAGTSAVTGVSAAPGGTSVGGDHDVVEDAVLAKHHETALVELEDGKERHDDDLGRGVLPEQVR
jgi:hypothetical protein